MTQRSNARLLADLAASQTREGRQRTGCFSIEGIRLFERALRAGETIESALVSESLERSTNERERDLIRALRASSCELQVASDEELNEWTGGRTFGALVGLVRLPKSRTVTSITAPRDRPNRAE